MDSKVETGAKFGRWTVVQKKNAAYGEAWQCVCECGRHATMTASRLQIDGRRFAKGEMSYFGCGHCRFNLDWAKQKNADRRYRATYRVWHNMKRRCFDRKCPNYKQYGGRGITVYNKWIESFRTFYEYVSVLEHYGEEGRSLDRINNDGNYEPGNLRWATAKEQCNNRRQKQKRLETVSE